VLSCKVVGIRAYKPHRPDEETGCKAACELNDPEADEFGLHYPKIRAADAALLTYANLSDAQCVAAALQRIFDSGSA
jgi:hypothetical protein